MSGEALWAEHRWLAERLARDFYFPGADEQDVRQEALIALWVATSQWDPAKGASFRSFAELVIRRRLATVLRLALGLKHRSLSESVRTAVNDDGLEVPVVDTLAATVRKALLAHSGKRLGGWPMESPALDALAALVEHARTLEREVVALKQHAANRSAIIVRLERVIDTLQAQSAAATSQIAAASDSRARLHDLFEAAEERIAALERERDEALAANEGKANLILHDALIARADRYEKALLWAIDEQNLGALIADKAAYEWWVGQIRARAALAGEDA